MTYRGVSAAIGGLAIAHSVLLFLRNIWCRDAWESVSAFNRMAWQSAMYAWMMATLNMPMNGRTGNYFIEPFLPSLYQMQVQTDGVLRALMFLECFRITLRWLNYMQHYPFRGVPAMTSLYVNQDLNTTVFKGFGSWRDVELLQTFFIIGRDMGFAQKDPLLWSAMSFGGIFVPLFLANSTNNTRKALIDHCHYLGYMFWFGATMLGQIGHLFFRQTYSNWTFGGGK